MSDPEQRKWKSNKIGMTFPFTFKVGQFMTGIGFGCGIGLGFGSPINFGSLPMGRELLGGLSGLTYSYGSYSRPLRQAVKKLGVANLDIGLGCGVGVGYGFGIGLALKPGTMSIITNFIQDSWLKFEKKFGGQLSNTQNGPLNSPPTGSQPFNFEKNLGQSTSISPVQNLGLLAPNLKRNNPREENAEQLRINQEVLLAILKLQQKVEDLENICQTVNDKTGKIGGSNGVKNRIKEENFKDLTNEELTLAYRNLGNPSWRNWIKERKKSK